MGATFAGRISKHRMGPRCVDLSSRRFIISAMRLSRRLAAILLLIAASFLHADPPNAPGPTEPPRSSKAKGAFKKHAESIAAASDAFYKAVTNADAELVTELDASLKAAASNQSPDEIVRIAAARNAAKLALADHLAKKTEAESAVTKLEAPPGRQLLESRLAGSKWSEEHPGVIWTLDKDGTAHMSDGRSASWAAISATSILLLVDNGWVDEWQFDEKLTTIHDLHGQLGSPWVSKRAD